MAGYWRNPEATEAAFTEDGWLKSGDIGMRRDDGYIQIVGRMSEMFKSGGYNVYPREVELALEEHDAVSMAAVVSVADPTFQEVGVAYVMGDDIDTDELRSFAAERLANYKIPKRIHVLDELPMLPIGKVDTTLIPGAEEAEEPPWGLIIGLGAVGAVAFALVVTRSRRRGRGDVDVDDLAHEVQELADRLLDLAGSPRQNIIATYDHLEHLLASGGRSRDDAETTAEFSARVLTELGVSSGSCVQLAALYQAVAYGEREASEGDQVEASELLSAVSDDLVERSRRLAEAASDRVGSDV